jgi:hypothetical protein
MARRMVSGRLQSSHESSRMKDQRRIGTPPRPWMQCGYMPYDLGVGLVTPGLEAYTVFINVVVSTFDFIVAEYCTEEDPCPRSFGAQPVSPFSIHSKAAEVVGSTMVAPNLALERGQSTTLSEGFLSESDAASIVASACEWHHSAHNFWFELQSAGCKQCAVMRERDAVSSVSSR